MPRANRYFLPGYIWHITHRCHKKEFLLKFARDRQRKKLCDVTSLKDLQNQHREWVEQELMLDLSKRDEIWSESIAVGCEAFIDQVKNSLGIKAEQKEIIEYEDSYFIKEGYSAYNAHLDGKMDPLRVENTIKWDVL